MTCIWAIPTICQMHRAPYTKRHPSPVRWINKPKKFTTSAACKNKARKMTRCCVELDFHIPASEKAAGWCKMCGEKRAERKIWKKCNSFHTLFTSPGLVVAWIHQMHPIIIVVFLVPVPGHHHHQTSSSCSFIVVGSCNGSLCTLRSLNSHFCLVHFRRVLLLDLQI